MIFIKKKKKKHCNNDNLTKACFRAVFSLDYKLGFEEGTFFTCLLIEKKFFFFFDRFCSIVLAMLISANKASKSWHYLPFLTLHPILIWTFSCLYHYKITEDDLLCVSVSKPPFYTLGQLLNIITPVLTLRHHHLCFLSKSLKPNLFILYFFPPSHSNSSQFCRNILSVNTLTILFSFLAIYLLTEQVGFLENFYKGKIIIIKLNKQKKFSVSLIFMSSLSFSVMCACFLSLPDNCHLPILTPHQSPTSSTTCSQLQALLAFSRRNSASFHLSRPIHKPVLISRMMPTTYLFIQLCFVSCLLISPCSVEHLPGSTASHHGNLSVLLLSSMVHS